MITAIDIGNTSIAFGWFEGKSLRAEQQLATVEQRTSDEYEALLTPLIERKFGNDIAVEQVVISSVVPAVCAALSETVQRMWGISPLVVGPGVRTGVALRVQEPQGLGADRVVNALAATKLFGAPSIVVDFGTAIAFDVIASDGAYEGGVIAPGPHIALEALVSRTAKLPHIELEAPRSVVGKTTVTAMQSGLVIGFSALIDGILEAIQEEYGVSKHIIATGAHAKFYSARSKRITHVEPHLTLQGLRLVAEINS